MMMVARVATAEHVGSAGGSLPQTPGSRSFPLGTHPGPQKRIGGPAQGQTAFITPLVTPDGIYSRPSSPYMQASPLLKGSESGGSAGSPQSPDAPSSASGASVGNAIGSGYTGNVSVAIRIKPSESSTKDPWYASNDRLIHTEFGEFQFDHVFTKGVSNNEVYRALGVPIIDKLFEGYNATIFAYGMTGSGKTFTMSGNKQEPGLIPQCVGNIFDRISSEHHAAGEFEVKVSYLEIYNEKIYDLLNYVDRQAGSTGQPSRNATGLKIRDDSKYGVKVVDLTEQVVSSHEDVMRWIATGDRNRKTGETDFNTRSSRSHAIVLLRLTHFDLKTGSEATSTLSLCDLAGSERAVTQIVRRKEGAFINKSLLALGTVIAKLSMLGSQASGQQPSPAAGHIPYRDSKLTRILQPALTGDSIITTICTIDSKAESSTETTNTVRFASRAKNIALNVRKNEMDSHAEKDTIIQNLRKQLDEQHATIVMLRRTAAAPSVNGAASPLDGPSGGTSLSERTHNMEKGLLEVENSILKTKLEHCEKLLDKDMMVLEDPHVREIVEMLPLDIASVLESKVQGMESQLRQYRVYVQKLESDLLKAQRNIITTHSVQFNRQSTANVQEKYGSDVDIELLLEEQEAELMELRNALKRKDKMIEALQSARRLRDSALSPTTTVLLQRKDSVIKPRDPQPV
ncbi:AaceriACR145Wp [[Ashbya] aceris (nom. inval.)]|nr:AaceriACR145Wp [[Ashbya] aceris (nom. inval.)]